MDHIEPDELAVLALDGGELGDEVRAHLDACDACAAEYAALRRTVDLGREGPAADLESPPARVWAGIHDELGLAPELAGDPFAGATAPVVATDTRHVPPRRTRTPAPVAPAPAGAAGRARARRWWPVAAAAAIIGLVAGVGIGVALGGRGGPDPSTVLATAELDAFPGWDSVGTATVEEDATGERTIVVDLAADVPDGEVREVWLIRADASGLVSLGLMDGDSVRLSVPAGIDLDEYPLVDVSAEPVDGDPAHSGDSIVRGELRAA